MTARTSSWDPVQYERHKRDRDRPALDLMVQIPPDLKPRTIWDLGCGTGEHAAVLAARHPLAKVWGLDSSQEMLARARVREAQVTWVQGDIAAFAPPEPPGLIFTNAALQWVDGHEALVPRLAAALAPGGVFACQVPLTYDGPTHRLMRETAAEGPWAARLAAVQGLRPVAPPETWYGWLSPLAAVDVWTTTYLHVLSGDDPVVDWMLGTGLRPMIQALDDPRMREAFLDAYRTRIAAAFPRRADGTTLLPFPRLFVLARRR
jgi:trans-aconitate 2-methyltransferase